MKSALSLFIALLIDLTNSWAVDSLFIYSGGKRNYHPVDTTKVLIDWQSTIDTADLEVALQDHPNLEADSFTRNRINGFNLHRITGNYLFDSVFRALESDNRTVRVNKVLKINERSSILVGDEIVCKFRPEIARALIDSICGINGIEILRESQYVHNQFVIRVSENCSSSTIDLPPKNWSS